MNAPANAAPIVVSPFANERIREWPIGHFRRFIELVLNEFPSRIIIVGTRAQRARANELVRGFPAEKVTNSCGTMSWTDVTNAVRSAPFVVCNNSGIAHLAATLGRWTLCVFSGSHSPVEWMPRGHRVVTISKSVSCAPCAIAGDFCPNHIACMTDLSPEVVLKHFLSLWNQEEFVRETVTPSTLATIRERSAIVVASVCISHDGISEGHQLLLSSALKHGIEPSIFEAVTPDAIKERGLPADCVVEISDLKWKSDRRADAWWHSPLLLTEIARTHSHVACWREAIEAGVDFLVVMEDNVEVIRSFEAADFEGDYDLKYIDRPSEWPGEADVSAYIISRAGLHKAVDLFSRIRMPLGLQLLTNCVPSTDIHHSRLPSRDARLKAEISASPIVKHINSRRIAGLPSMLTPLPKELNLGGGSSADYLELTNFSVEAERLWTNGPHARISLQVPQSESNFVAITFGTWAFTWPNAVPHQIVEVILDGVKVADWKYEDRLPTDRTIIIDTTKLVHAGRVTLELSIPCCARPCDFGLNTDQRRLGVAFTRIEWEEVADVDALKRNLQSYGRRVGTEARKSFDYKLRTGFWDRYVRGPNVLDVGFKGYEAGEPCVPILNGAIGVDLDYPGYDGRTLPFADESQDAVYSSHCLEHIADPAAAIAEWYRVTKFGGHIIAVVPSALLYEKKAEPPSRWNEDHKRFYSPTSLVKEFEEALAPNSYRVRHLAENDRDYDYRIPPEQHASGCYEIEIVVEKIHPPAWTV